MTTEAPTRRAAFTEIRTLQLSPEMDERLRRLSERDGVPVSSLIRQAVSRMLNAEGV